jgi:hypothetical protein
LRQWLIGICFCLLAAFFISDISEGAGTLKVTFKSKAANGTEQPLSYAYAYLRSAAVEPPMEKHFSPPDYIIGPSDSIGRISGSVPEGTYYVRITRRNPVEIRPLGPPEAGDFTWYQVATVTISNNSVTDLGTKYAWAFGSAPIVISGSVRNTYTGAPLAGRYVKATIVPCIQGEYAYDGTPSNECGPEKHLALQRTDANGNYKLYLREPGTFYFYQSPCLGDQHQEFSGNPCIGTYTGPVTVNMGEEKVVNITGI